MYQRIDGSQWRHIWLAGDIHGCHALLMAHLRSLKFNPWRDLLISPGDMIDRGPESAKCLNLLTRKWFRATLGNHEQMALDALDNGERWQWYLNGGDWYGDCTASQRRQLDGLFSLCRELPAIIEVRSVSGVHVVAHADYPAAVYRWRQPVDLQQVLWNRRRLEDHLQGRHAAIAGADHFWFGHTPLRQRYDVDNQHYIDTGAVFGGRLTLARLQ